MRRITVLLAASVLSACAGRPVDSSLDAEAKLFRAPSDKALVYVVPSTNRATVSIAVDGRKLATLANVNYLRLEMAPGRHTLSVTRTSVLPAVLREKPQTVTLEAEAGHCYYLRTAWTDEGESWREFSVFWEAMSEEDGQREVNVRWLALPEN